MFDLKYDAKARLIFKFIRGIFTANTERKKNKFWVNAINTLEKRMHFFWKGKKPKRLNN
jgi:hypothetical protein